MIFTPQLNTDKDLQSSVYPWAQWKFMPNLKKPPQKHSRHIMSKRMERAWGHSDFGLWPPKSNQYSLEFQANVSGKFEEISTRLLWYPVQKNGRDTLSTKRPLPWFVPMRRHKKTPCSKGGENKPKDGVITHVRTQLTHWKLNNFPLKIMLQSIFIGFYKSKI